MTIVLTSSNGSFVFLKWFVILFPWKFLCLNSTYVSTCSRKIDYTYKEVAYPSKILTEMCDL